MVGIRFDPRWEAVYAAGFSQRWPWDCVVSFVFRHAPADRPRSEVAICELGFGTGSNLWFAAREGFRVAGLDGSPTAVAAARARLAEERLDGDLRVGDFTAPLPFADASFDLVIDRGALTCAGKSAVRRTIGEIRRILRPGGAFLFSPYSADHPAARLGRPIGDGLVTDIPTTGLAGLGAIGFWGEEEVRAAFDEGWRIVSLSHLVADDLVDPNRSRGEWYAVARRV